VRILVSGAGGFLGQSVVEQLLQRGHSVRAIVRPSSVAPRWEGDDVEIFRADLRTSGNLAEAFNSVDTAVHLAAAVTGNEDLQFASTVVGTERFLDAMGKSSTKRLIHISSIAVYDWSSARSVMDEETPLVNKIYEMGGYTIAKVWQERLVSRAAHMNGWHVTIMRPGFIWGPGHADIAGMGRQFGRLYLTFGTRTRLPLSHVLNCSDCIVLAIVTPTKGNKIVNVVDDDDVSVWRYVSEFRRRSGKSGVIVPIPYHMGHGLAKLAMITSQAAFGSKGKLPSLLVPRRFESQFKPLRFSNQKIKNELGWSQRYSFKQCLETTFGSLQKAQQ
jgi:nucleoside-diphosphate-sugar epimerase